MESTPSPDPSPTPARDPSPAPSRTTPPRTPTSPHTPHTTRRQTLAALAATAATAAVPVLAPGAASARDRGERPVADTVLHNGRVTTLDPRHPEATALAVRGDRVLAVGPDARIRRLAGDHTRLIDLRGRRVIPGLTDSHTHLIRQGLSYTQELSLAGVRSVAEALRLIRHQAEHTPPPQWVRVVGGFTRHQFADGRLPTLAELNAAAPDRPVFLLHLYDRALLNRTALRILGFTKSTPAPPGSEIEHDAAGNPTGLLIARPSATLLYSTLARLPGLSPADQSVSTRHYLRHLNARGVTGVMDAGGGHQTFPADYDVVGRLHRAGQLTARIGYHVFTQRPGDELADFRRLADLVSPGDGDGMLRMLGAGEMLACSAADFENFEEPRPRLPDTMEDQLRGVLAFLGERRWPFRLHTTYEESIKRFLDVIEDVHGRGGPDVPFILDHAETISARSIDRVARLGGRIAVQHRMAFQGETFMARYGAAATAHTPPVRRMLRAGVPVGLGTDATRVASDNVWRALHWLVTGRSVGGQVLHPPEHRLDRITALRLLTQGSAALADEDRDKGTLSPGRYADLAVLREDYLTVPAERIPEMVSVLTMVGGRVIHGAAEHTALNPPLPPVRPSYSPLLTGANAP
ncbi:amidohydrolase [Streptomyces sp. LNU-CPARS28]|uniref:amidohydrolase n=1 Tax=Streptomyces sp. LNU-CPARS28 TaxID=3137371 RepID=UPI0031361514